MKKISGVTTDVKQKRSVILDDGTQFTFVMEYKPLQLGWFINELTYDGWTLNGLRITNQPNLLRQWKNQIPFGLACRTKNNREPTLLEDFSSSESELFVLSEAEVTAYEDFLSER